MIFPFITSIKLASKAYEKHSPKYKKKQQWKILFYTLLNPVFSDKWFKFIKSPEFYNIYLHRTRIYIKPFRPYISTKWNKKQKIKVITDTYRFLQTKNLLNKILSNNLIISNIKFNDQQSGILKLEYDERFRKEGELVLTFECNNCGGKIMSVAFSFKETHNKNWDCIVGCVQGHCNKEYFNLSQKLLNRMRPNSFIIFSLQEFVRNLNCNNIFCAGNAIQANQKKHFINIKKIHKINFDYNKFYEEAGAVKYNDNWYKLPLKPKLKDIETIKSKKRNLYRKRYKMLDEISIQIKNNTTLL